jgi:hypothetical protein
VAAADAGRPLALAHVSDFSRDYDARWQHIVDEFHAANAAKDQAGQGPGGACVAQDTAHWDVGRVVVDPRSVVKITNSWSECKR